jgi:putative Holliday junction resolvase
MDASPAAADRASRWSQLLGWDAASSAGESQNAWLTVAADERIIFAASVEATPPACWTSRRSAATPARLSGGPCRPAVVLALDYGRRRIGVAVGIGGIGTATALGAVTAAAEPNWAQLDRLLREWAPGRLIVGLPYHMDGSDNDLMASRAFAGALAGRYGLPVDLVDERLTSHEAAAELRAERRSGFRTRRIRREDIDANAARLILETWLRGRTGETSGQQQQQGERQ